VAVAPVQAGLPTRDRGSYDFINLHRLKSRARAVEDAAAAREGRFDGRTAESTKATTSWWKGSAHANVGEIVVAIVDNEFTVKYLSGSATSSC